MTVYVLQCWGELIEGVVSTEARARELGFGDPDDKVAGKNGQFFKFRVDEVED